MARQWITYDKLLDGTISLADIAEMNDAISLMDENTRLANEGPNG